MARMARLKTEPPALTPIEPQTFSREADRERLSEVAIKAFLALMKAWGLSNAESAGLLGVSASSLDRIKRGSRPALSQDQLTRVSALVGIYKGLHLLFVDGAADDVDPQGEPRRPVRPEDADRGDDRGRHPADARRPPLCRRRARRPLKPGRMPDSPPVVREAFPKTVRLVSTARLRPPVLAGLVGADDLAALAEIEGATSQRLIAEAHGTAGFGRDEFVHGVPYASFVNAAFAYAKPLEPNRFNAQRGAWYAALAVQTSMREVAWHMTDFLAKSGEYRGVVDYAEMFASMAGEFVDLRAAGAASVSRSGSGDRISGRQCDRRFRLCARAQRNHLSVRSGFRRNLPRGAAASRGAVGRPGGGLPV